MDRNDETAFFFIKSITSLEEKREIDNKLIQLKELHIFYKYIINNLIYKTTAQCEHLQETMKEKILNLNRIRERT
jgi:hypothetical protein